MKTDDLIEALSRGGDSAPKRNLPLQLALALVVGFLAGAGLLAALWGIRPDIVSASLPVLSKVAFSALAAAVCLPVLMRLSRPGQPVGRRTWMLGGFIALSAIVTGAALLGVDPAQRVCAWTGNDFPWCIAIVPVLAIPTAGLLGWIVRDLAPTRLAATGAMLGAVSGGIGAMAYAMHCPVDSVAFVTTWYLLAIALCAGIGAVAGARLLRW